MKRAVAPQEERRTMSMTQSFCPGCGDEKQYPAKLPEGARPFIVCQACHRLLKLTWRPFLEEVDPASAPLVVKAEYDRYLDATTELRLKQARERPERKLIV